MPDFQSAVNIYNPLGIVGELAFTGPVRAAPYNLVSSPRLNIVGYAYTALTPANPDPVYNVPPGSTLGSPVAGTARAGGTGVFAGILVNPKEYASGGTLGAPLAPTLAVPENSVGSLLTMGYIFANLPGLANPGDLVTYDVVSGALSSIPPVTNFTASIAPGGASTPDVLTVSAITSGTLGVGSLISGVGIPPGTYIDSLGTGLGGTGTYNLSTINELTVASRAMTAPNTPSAAASFTGSIAAGTPDVLTVTAVASGQLSVGDPIFGTGIPANTVIASFGTGVGGTGTYNLNTAGTTFASGAITTPGYALVPNCVVDRYQSNATGGVAVLKLTN